MTEAPKSKVALAAYEGGKAAANEYMAQFTQNLQDKIVNAEIVGMGIGTRVANDNAPVYTPGSYGQGGTPTYYYFNTPTKEQLEAMSELTPLGYRLTYKLAMDVYNNNFTFEFPKNKDLKVGEVDQINAEIQDHLMDIKFYDQAWLACAFDYVQGESLLMTYREGDGVTSMESAKAMTTQDPKYIGMMTPADWEKPVIRVEAINYQDYMIPTIGFFGLPDWYQIQFTIQGNNKSGYYVHPSRVIRWRSVPNDYDQFKGQSMLKACFTQLQIIHQIHVDTGRYVHRIGPGIPWIRNRALRTQADVVKFKGNLGDVKALDFLITNMDVDQIKLVGTEGNDVNFPQLEDMMVNQTCVASGIPKVILTGNQVGVTKAGAVMEAQYFAVLDNLHTRQNLLVREFVSHDPFFTIIFKKYKINHYNLNWGLRQVMTDREQAELDQIIYTNISTMQMFATFDEVRQKAKLPTWVEKFAKISGGEAMCHNLYGRTPQELDLIIPRLAEFRARFVQEQLESPQEQEGSSNPENPTNVARQEGTGQTSNQGGKGLAANKSDPYEKEAARRESKALRVGDNAKDLLAQLDTYKDLCDKLNTDLTIILKDNKDKDMEISKQKLADELGVGKQTLYKLLNGIADIRAKRDKQ